jgi:elongation factor G
MEDRGNAKVIDRDGAAGQMFGYINTCAPCRKGRAQYTMSFDHYEPVPAQTLRKKSKRNRGQE